MYHIHLNFNPVSYSAEIQLLEHFSKFNVVDSIRYKHYGLSLTIVVNDLNELIALLKSIDWIKISTFSFYKHD